MLSNNRIKLLQVMIFYSLLTFFLLPYITYYYIKTNDGITHGIIIGSIISVFLWIKFGNNYVMS